jgi:hypothetical protein
VAVVGPDGTPLAGASVRGTGDRRVEAGPLGAATFTAVGLDPDHPRILTVWHPARRLAGHAVLRGDEPEPVAVKLAPWGAVTARILDTDGKPLAGAKVDLENYDGDEPVPAHRPGREAVVTDEDGRFRAEGLAPGLEYRVVVFKRDGLPGFRNKAFEKVKVEPGKTADLGEAQVRTITGG